jgi:hypothetical protein
MISIFSHEYSNISGNFLYKIFHNVFPFCGSEFYKENMFFLIYTVSLIKEKPLINLRSWMIRWSIIYLISAWSSESILPYM